MPLSRRSGMGRPVKPGESENLPHYFFASGIKRHAAMKKNIFPFPGKGWLRASFRKMQDRLILALLYRFIPFVPTHSFGTHVSLPEHLLTINGERSLSLYCHCPVVLFQSGGITLQAQDSCMRTDICRCSAYEDFSFDGNTLTSFPAWRNN